MGGGTVIDHVHRFVLPAAYALLPPQMNSPAATALLLAIGLQESKFLHRAQIGGPARGFWQFERGGGVQGVMAHPSTGALVRRALRELRYERIANSPTDLHALITDNDTVAAVFARLLLWTVPGRLPNRNEADYGWKCYLSGWRPGKPHRSTWDAYFVSAWQRVDDMEQVA